MPPTSAWWARLAAQPTTRRRRSTGATRVMSLRWVPAGERVVEDHLLARPQPRRERIDRGAHRRRHRAEVHGDVLGLHEQLAVGGEQRRRAVGPLLDVGAERGPPQHRAHLLGDPGQARDEHLQLGGIERHRHRIEQNAPVARRAIGAPAVRAPRSCSRARRRRPGHRRDDDHRSAAELSGRWATASTPGRAARRPRPAAWVGGSRCAARARRGTRRRRHGELVALAGVPAVEQRLDLGSGHRRTSSAHLAGRALPARGREPWWSAGSGHDRTRSRCRARTAARRRRARPRAAAR